MFTKGDIRPFKSVVVSFDLNLKMAILLWSFIDLQQIIAWISNVVKIDLGKSHTLETHKVSNSL